MNRPNWYTEDNDKSWGNVKDAFRKDWEQTKHDFGSKTAPDLGQDAGDTIREATTGKTDFETREPSFRFGHAAREHYGTKYPAWSTDLENDLRSDYGTDYDRDRDDIRRAYDYNRGKS